MAQADANFTASQARLMDRYGEGCTIRRPHTLKRFDGTTVTALEVKTTAAAGASSVVLELADAERFESGGELPVGIVLTINAVAYTVQAAAEVVTATRQVTATISPVLAAEATAGTAVTLPVAASWVGTATAAPRYYEDGVSAFSSPSSGVTLGSRVATVERWSDSIELRGGNRGDYLDDANGTNLGRFIQVTDSTPSAFEGIVQ